MRRHRRNAASRRPEPEIDRLARLARAAWMARAGGMCPRLAKMLRNPSAHAAHLAFVVASHLPWEQFLQLDRDPSPILRAEAARHWAMLKGRDGLDVAPNFGLPVHRFGLREVYAEWLRRCGQMRALIARLAQDPSPAVREAVRRSTWAA